MDAFMFNSTKPAPPDKLGWDNVAIGSSLILVNAAISIYFGLGLATSLAISTVRCIVQLTILGMILNTVFDHDTPGVVSLLALTMMTISAVEVYSRVKSRYLHMFPSVWLSMVLSTLLVSYIGNNFAIKAQPWYNARDYITILVSGVAVGITSTITQLSDHKERIELYLAFGASRWEAARPVSVEAIRLALLPHINMMSVIGLISIPGMMTGQILGGASINDAVKYQMLIMFMVMASVGLATVSAVVVCLYICFDGESRLRLDRIQPPKKGNAVTWAQVQAWLTRA
ncbi:hypothetical protein HK101_008544 [Irineochytrium annulatum]|nr:hypothetical protein HK101_008544 [Irineochytrium annulatum]